MLLYFLKKCIISKSSRKERSYMSEIKQEMNTDLLIEQYKLYVQLKDKFTDRSFATNKFFLVLIIIIFSLLVALHDDKFYYFLSSRSILSVIGMAICVLWWSNIDTYGVLLGVKIRGVIQEMEKHLPFECHLMEKNALDDYRRQKKAFVFSDMQKLLATLVFVFFMAIFLVSIFSFYMSNIYSTFHLKM